MLDVGSVVTFKRGSKLAAEQVIRMKENGDDYRIEVRGRSGKSLVLPSFIESGCMIWPDYLMADTFMEGGWEALAKRGFVNTYFFDAKKAREEDKKSRLARKPAMVKEDQCYEYEQR